MKRHSKTSVNENRRSHSPIFYDDRKGLGYGLSVPSGRNEPRSSTSHFPYVDPDPFSGDDFEEGEGVIDDILAKTNMGYTPVDSLAVSKTDPFYFVAGNLKISEMAIAKNSISPIPGLYRDRANALGGFTQQKAYSEYPARRTGTLQGYFHRPPVPSVPMPDEIGAYRLSDMLSDDELAVARVRATQDYIDDLSRVTEGGVRFV